MKPSWQSRKTCGANRETGECDAEPRPGKLETQHAGRTSARPDRARHQGGGRAFASDDDVHTRCGQSISRWLRVWPARQCHHAPCRGGACRDREGARGSAVRVRHGGRHRDRAQPFGTLPHLGVRSDVLGVPALAAHRSRALGHKVDFVDSTDPAALSAAIKPGTTKLVYIETPGNPLWTISDIAAIAALAHDAGALLAVDSTVATPIFTRPLELGADLVMHSASKYLNGHSDVIAGMVATARAGEAWDRIKAVRTQFGAVLGPFEAWLLLRGLRTLEVRVKRQAASAMLLATRLANHGRVAQVLYPGLPEHSGHDVAQRQMRGGFGAMLSVRVKGGESAAIAAAARVQLWKRATSLGGVESLIEHRASVEGANSPCPPDLLRLSVGLEDPDDLMRDLDQALMHGP